MKIKSMRLDIELDRCIHRCRESSAIGKTALAKLAKSDASYPHQIILLDKKEDYDLFLEHGLITNENTIVVFDRMDLLGTQAVWDKLRTLKNSCVLVDAKRLWLSPVKYKLARFTWEGKVLTIRDGNIRYR
ncbi:hypothetical protein [Brotaphodocola sp.]|uniref:hypothetical protein n=1 Tax=Brotaphodocola sp. TaxID=3073577 RepID=UPI003D7F102B